MNCFTKSAYSVAGSSLFVVVAAYAAPSPDTSSLSAERAPSSDLAGAAADDSERVDGATPPSEPFIEGKGERILACMSNHENAQLARLNGEFVEAIRELKACSSPECPGALRADCFTWRQELNALIPTVIVVAEGDLGDMAEARVFADGIAVRESLDGRPIALDPGPHVLTVARPDGLSKEQRVVLSEGERGRRIVFDFRSKPRDFVPATEPPTSTIRPIPPGVYILGATAFVGLGVGVGFGSDAWSKSRTARDLCAPLCDADVSRAVSQRARVADVALGIAVAATIGAIVVYSYRPERVVPAEQISLKWIPSGRGGEFSLEGAF